jgi:hypothetical protein
VTLGILATLISIGASSAYADEIDAQRVYRSGYHLGRGDTGIAHCEYEDCLFYNPAALAEGKGIYRRTVFASPQIEFSKATRDFVRQIGVEDADEVETVRENIGKPNHVGAQNFTGILLRRVAIGAFFSANANLMAFKDPNYGGLETIDAEVTENVGMTFTLAEQFGKSWMVGVTGKYLQRGRGGVVASVADSEAATEQFQDTDSLLGQGTGPGADLGVLWKGKGRSKPTFGVLVANVGDTSIIAEEETDQNLNLKQTVNAGVSIAPGTKFSRVRLLLDVRDILGQVQENDRKKVHIGGELTVRDAFGITTGLNQGSPTFGVYGDLWLMRFDAGMYTQEIGERVGKRSDTRFYFRFKTGI